MTGTCVRRRADGTVLTVTVLDGQAGLSLRGEADMLGPGRHRIVAG